MNLFVSYSRLDGEFVNRLVVDIEAVGHLVWIDTEDITGGGQDRWRRSIVRGIGQAETVLLVLSPQSVVSVNVEKELSVASEMNKRVVPVQFQPCELGEGFVYELAGVQRIDFSAAAYPVALAGLVRHLGGPVAGGGTMAPVVATTNSPHNRPQQTPKQTPQNTPREVPIATAGVRRGPNMRVLVGIGAVVVACLIVVLIVTSGNDNNGALSPRTSSPLTSGPATPTSDMTKVESILDGWAEKTSVREWDAVRLVSLNEANKSDAEFAKFYGAQGAAKSMKAVHVFVAAVAPNGDGSYTAYGAVIAWDFYDDPPPISTNIGCRQWIVDVAVGTLKATQFPKPQNSTTRIPREAPEAEFEAIYTSYCTNE